MAKIQFPVVELDNNKFQVIVDLALYSKDVITAAIYKFSHLFYIHQQTDKSNPNLVFVIFESKDDNAITVDIPKQTINTAVAALQKKGVAFLSPIPGTRNKKNIAFTEFGRDFAEKTVGILRMAELDALAELSPEERELYIRLNEKYNCRLIEKLYRIMDEVNQDRKDCD